MEQTANQNEKISRMGYIVSFGILIAFIVDGLDMQLLSLALPLLMKDFHLSTTQAGSLGTLTLLGQGIGGMLASWASDRIGRVKLVLWSLITFSVCTCALGFTQDVYQFGFIRFLSGFGLSGVWMCGTMVVSEYIPTSRRTLFLSILQAGWSVGYIIAAMISSYVQPLYGWRPMFIGTIVPSIISYLLLFRMEDSPAWKAARDIRLAEAKSDAGKKKSKNEWAEIFGTPAVKRNFWAWGVAACMLQIGYYGAANWLPTYLVREMGVNLKSMGWYVSLTYLFAIFGKILFGWLSDTFGRKVAWVASCVGTAAMLPLIVNYSTPGNVAMYLLIFGLVYAAPYALIATYMSESFPSSVRGTAYGAAYNSGRIIAIAAPIMIGFLATKYSIGYGMALLGIAYLICGVVPGLFVPEKQYDPKAGEVSKEAKSDAAST